MGVIDIIAVLAVVAFGWLVLGVFNQRMPHAEARLVTLSFGMHVLASFITAVVSEILYHGVVDFAGFARAGEFIAMAIRQDPLEVLPRSVLLFFHQDTIINVPLNFEAKGGRSTVSMWILAAYGNLLFAGSFQATAAACALFSFAGKLAAYRTLRTYFDEAMRPWVAGAMLLVPSVVYWTSGLIKEGIAVGGLGFALAGFHAFFRSGFVRKGALSGLLLGACGCVLVVVIKPYLLMALGFGLGALFYVRVATRGGTAPFQMRPIVLVAAAGIALAGVVLIGRLFPLFAVDNLGEAASTMQYYGRRAGGGSFYFLGDPSESSLLGQLRYAPIAVFTALYRPTLLDVSNPMLAVNAVETTALLAATALVLFRTGIRRATSQVFHNPALAFSVAFALPLALGVGLVSNNLGTLSRYRCPLVPYQALTIVVLAVGTRPAVRASTSTSTPAPAPSHPGPPPGPHEVLPRRVVDRVRQRANR